MDIKHDLVNSYGFKLIKEENKSYYYLVVSGRLRFVLFKELINNKPRLSLMLENAKKYLPIAAKYGVQYRELKNDLYIAYGKNNFEMIQKAKYAINELLHKIELEFGVLGEDFKYHMV